MRGKLFVCLYSIFLIGLFITCCYLMSIVNPPRLPFNETRRFNVGNNLYRRVPHDNPDYGLEKIPEGVDADEFRRHLMQRLIKYDVEKEKTPYESIQRVVPPIWPRDNIVEEKADKQKSKEPNPKGFITFSPVKGHRRSVIDNKLHDIKAGPGSILLKIVDNSGHKKIEIKYISGENLETNKLRKNRSPYYLSQLKSNVTQKEMSKVYQSANNNNYEDENDKVIQMKADDVILINIVDDSDILVEKNIFSGVNNTDDMQELVMNMTDINYINKTWTNETKLVNAEEPEKKSKEPMNNGVYAFNLLFNGENRTIDSRNFSNQEYKSDPLISMLPCLNHTSGSTESMPLVRTN